MRIGVVIGRPGGYGDTLSQLVAEYEQARAADVPSVWMTQHLGFDALTLISSSWGVDGDVEVGTAVIPVQTRHPVVLANRRSPRKRCVVAGWRSDLASRMRTRSRDCTDFLVAVP